MNEWRQDLGRVLDALSGREDIDATRIAYFGLSFGGSTAFPLIALEDRLKVAVLAPAGFTYRPMPPVKPTRSVTTTLPRTGIPVLMMGGRHDYIFPLEAAQSPMFDLLAARRLIRSGTTCLRERAYRFSAKRDDSRGAGLASIVTSGPSLTEPLASRVSHVGWAVSSCFPDSRLYSLPHCSASDSLEAEKAGGIGLGHHVDLRLAEALFCEDSQRDLKGLGVVHPAGLAEIGAQNDVLRTERSNVRKLCGP